MTQSLIYLRGSYNAPICLQEQNNHLFVQNTETWTTKREKPRTAVDTKTEKPGILSAKTEKPISKPKNPMSPS